MGVPSFRSDRRRTKLICTIGPASAERIAELTEAGMDVARINFSHGSPESHAAAARAVQGARSDERAVGILVDLPGPKIRLGELEGDAVTLEAGRPFHLRVSGSEAPGDENGAFVSYPALGHDVRLGDPILLADGAAELRVTAVDGDVRAEIVRGGTIRSRAGVAIPAGRMSAPALTERDLSDIPRAIAIGANYVGQSFVRHADDVRQLRRALGEDGPLIVAKIETRPAVDSFDAILDVVDAVMIARGDLGVELPYEEVPLVQKQLVRRALDRGVPTIVATQMLESMTAAPRPTRAEASDVANAVFDGADAIMLSGETAIGEYPVEAARAAARIAAYGETHGGALLPAGMPRPPGTGGGAIAFAAVALAAADPAIEAIGCYTRSGRTALILSSLRPRVPIIAFSPERTVVDRLALVHGVRARRCAPFAVSDPIGELERALDAAGLLDDGTTAVLLGSTGRPGSAPDVLGVHRVVGAPVPGMAHSP